MSTDTPKDVIDDQITVKVFRDGRLRTRIHWDWNGDRVRVRVPRRLSKVQVDRHVAEIVDEVRRRRARVRARADRDLEAMARKVNESCFDSQISWHSIRWVSNMHKRLASCTVGGPTDGDIRISDRIKGWPQWVVEYVVAHELAHRRFPNHSAGFWAFVGRYSRSERARGFIQGVAFQAGENDDEWL